MNTRSIFVVAMALVLTAAAFAIAAQKSSDGPRLPSSLAHPDSPKKAPDADGFMQRWLIVEPIRVGRQLTDSVVQAEVKREYFPNQFTALPQDGDKVKVDGTELTWHAIDTRNFNVNLYHFAHAYGKPSSDAR